jgi:hypothetical protein
MKLRKDKVEEIERAEIARRFQVVLVLSTFYHLELRWVEPLKTL